MVVQSKTGRMIHLKPALAALLALSTQCVAIDLFVKSSGGNKTTDIMYGLMHEVCVLRDLPFVFAHC